MTETAAELAQRIDSVRFTPVRLREGYDTGQVDALLDLLSAAAREGRSLGPVRDAARFETTRLSEGYDIKEVDDFLADLPAGAADSGTTQQAATGQESELLRQLRAVTFEPTRLREGYDMGEVDRFLDRLVAEASAGRPLASLITGATFGTVRLREGYDITEVDAFLARFAAS